MEPQGFCGDQSSQRDSGPAQQAQALCVQLRMGPGGTALVPANVSLIQGALCPCPQGARAGEWWEGVSPPVLRLSQEETEASLVPRLWDSCS
jgi:hypothetical protein